MNGNKIWGTMFLTTAILLFCGLMIGLAAVEATARENFGKILAGMAFIGIFAYMSHLAFHFHDEEKHNERREEP